jgi:hypothetical protein
MHHLEVPERMQLPLLKANRVLRVHGMSAGTVTNSRGHDGNASQRLQSIVQGCKSGSIETVIVGNQEVHGGFKSGERKETGD